MCAIMAGLILPACIDGKRNLYSEYHRILPEGWRFGEEVFFTPVHSDSLCSGRFVVALRHDNSYPFTEIRLEVIHEDRGREVRDTVDIELAGSYGQWRGSGGSCFGNKGQDTPPDAHRHPAWCQPGGSVLCS